MNTKPLHGAAKAAAERKAAKAEPAPAPAPFRRYVPQLFANDVPTRRLPPQEPKK